VEYFYGDLRDKDDCELFCSGAEGSILFHLAGLIHPKRIQDLYTVNVECTKNIHKAAEKCKLKRVVTMSSNSPVGCNSNKTCLFDENAPYRPYMHYGRAKREMEEYIIGVQKAGKLETVIVRGTWFYGPYQPQRQSLFFKMICDGKAPIVGSGDNLRSMSYIENLCQGLILAALSEKANGQIYWIADERPYTMNEIVDTVENLLEKEFGQTCAHKRMRLPGVASEVALMVDRLLQTVGLYHQKIHVLSEMNKNIACSVEKAKKELGYAPKVDLKEGMRRSLKWMQDSGQFASTFQ